MTNVEEMKSFTYDVVFDYEWLLEIVGNITPEHKWSMMLSEANFLRHTSTFGFALVVKSTESDNDERYLITVDLSKAVYEDRKVTIPYSQDDINIYDKDGKYIDSLYTLTAMIGDEAEKFLLDCIRDIEEERTNDYNNFYEHALQVLGQNAHILKESIVSGISLAKANKKLTQFKLAEIIRDNIIGTHIFDKSMRYAWEVETVKDVLYNLLTSNMRSLNKILGNNTERNECVVGDYILTPAKLPDGLCFVLLETLSSSGSDVSYSVQDKYNITQ